MSALIITAMDGASDFQFAQQSPGQRVFVIDGPTSYICDPATNRMLRYSNYAFSAAQPTPPVGGTSGVVISQLSGCSMTYSPGTSQRGGILTIEITSHRSRVQGQGPMGQFAVIHLTRTAF